jgi:hypothetical protein
MDRTRFSDAAEPLRPGRDMRLPGFAHGCLQEEGKMQRAVHAAVIREELARQPHDWPYEEWVIRVWTLDTVLEHRAVRRVLDSHVFG